MVSVIMAVGVVGLIIGTRFRVPALLLASILAAAAGVAAALSAQQPAALTVLFTVFCVVVLSAGYVAGLCGMLGLRRLARRHH